MNTWQNLFEQWLAQTPVILACFAGVAVSVLNLKKYRRAAIFGVLGFALIGAVHFFSPVAYTVLNEIAIKTGSPRLIYRVYGAFVSLMSAAGLVSLMVAAFSGRTDGNEKIV